MRCTASRMRNRRTFPPSREVNFRDFLVQRIRWIRIERRGGEGGSLDTLFDGEGGEKGVTIVFAVEIVRVTGFRASYDRVASSLLTLNRIVFQFLLFPRFSVSTSSPPGDARTLEGVRLSNGINGVGENKF